MPIRTFETEEYYAKYEFSKPHLISVSDCESVSIEELIRLAKDMRKASLRGEQLGLSDDEVAFFWQAE